MAESKEEIIRWLETLPENSLVGIDDGGLALREVGGEAYYEIGGMPDEVEEPADDAVRPGFPVTGLDEDEIINLAKVNRHALYDLEQMYPEVARFMQVHARDVGVWLPDNPCYQPGVWCVKSDSVVYVLRQDYCKERDAQRPNRPVRSTGTGA